MAKRIEFTPGIESMRGSFSPKQKLQYALHNNPAFDAPVGRQYARNYQANFVGAKRSATGLKYFFTKTKSATLVTPASKLRMAITGGVGAIYAAILEAETMKTRLEYAWKNYFHSTKTFRAWCFVYLTDMLTRKAKNIQMGRDAQGELIYVGNPWNASTTTTYIPAISEDVLVKFWLQLAAIDGGAAPIYFTVEGKRAIAFAGQIFNTIADNTAGTWSRLNVCHLLYQGVDMFVENTNQPLLYNGGDVAADSAVVTDGKYTIGV